MFYHSLLTDRNHANFEAPRVFAQHKVTVHLPRRPYVKVLPDIPTIRPFEALASGIPLIFSTWNDVEGLIRPERDFLFARSGLQTIHANEIPAPTVSISCTVYAKDFADTCPLLWKSPMRNR